MWEALVAQTGGGRAGAGKMPEASNWCIACGLHASKRRRNLVEFIQKHPQLSNSALNSSSFAKTAEKAPHLQLGELKLPWCQMVD